RRAGSQELRGGLPGAGGRKDVENGGLRWIAWKGRFDQGNSEAAEAARGLGKNGKLTEPVTISDDRLAVSAQIIEKRVVNDLGAGFDFCGKGNLGCFDFFRKPQIT